MGVGNGVLGRNGFLARLRRNHSNCDQERLTIILLDFFYSWPLLLSLTRRDKSVPRSNSRPTRTRMPHPRSSTNHCYCCQRPFRTASASISACLLFTVPAACSCPYPLSADSKTKTDNQKMIYAQKASLSRPMAIRSMQRSAEGGRRSYAFAGATQECVCCCC